MTPADMATLHAAAFTHERPWTAAEFADLLASPHVHAHTLPRGFALTRIIVDEVELLTLAVAPAHHRKGIAHSLMQGWMAQARTGGAIAAFLEVASDNAAALALYQNHGFKQISRRKGYYSRANAPNADALILKRALTTG